MAKSVVALTTVAKKEDAELIAKHIVEKRLAACVTILSGATSFYHWKGKLCREEEYLLVFKTIDLKIASLEKEIASIHPYELPEFIVLTVTRGSRRYLEWIQSSVGGRFHKATESKTSRL